MNRRALTTSLIIATVLQLAMVLAGHWTPAVAALFAPVGMGISLVGGAIYVIAARPDWKTGLLGGVIAGGVSALIGIAVSVALGDVPVMILVIGTLSSVATGFIGAALARLFVKP